MEALKRDRDLAQSQLDELQKKVNINQPVIILININE